MAHDGRSIWFQAGPYRGWSLDADRFTDHDGGNASIQIRIETQPPPGCTVGRTGMVQLAPGMDGYDVAERALHGHGRPPMEAVLTWLLDATEAALTDRDRHIDGTLRDYWAQIVADGRADRDIFTHMWGDGPEPAFQVLPTEAERTASAADRERRRAAALARMAEQMPTVPTVVARSPLG